MNHEFKKSFKNNFKIKDNLSEFDMDSLDKGLEIEKQDVDSESSISMLSQKTKRQKINCNEDEREEENNNKEKIFSIIIDIISNSTLKYFFDMFNSINF